MTSCRMPMSRASSRAVASSDRGTLALSAVTATVRSPSARNAAFATTVLSMPPLNATATPGTSARTASKQSRLAASSGLRLLTDIWEVYQSPRTAVRGLMRAHGQHGAGGVTDDLFRNAAEEEVRQPGPAVGANAQQVGLQLPG